MFYWVKPRLHFESRIRAPTNLDFATLGADMRSLSLLASLLLIPVAARAESPHPLRYIPSEANLILRVEKPRLLVETITQHQVVREMQQLPFVREQLESPVFQRFLQLVSYYEQDLGMKWPELLDKLAGNGLTLAAKVAGDNSPVVLCVDGTDEELTKRFVNLAVSVFEQELARQESKEKVEKGNYRGIDGFKIGDLRIARIGPTLLISNKKETLKAAVDLHFNEGKSLKDVSGPTEARKILHADSLAWLWLDLDVARNAPNAKELFAIPSNDPVQTIAIGGWVNVVKRAKFLAAGLHKEKDNFHLSLRFPGAGYDGVPEALAVHVPAKDSMGTLEPLEPKNVMLSLSFHFDFKEFWERKDKLFNEKVVKELANGEKQFGLFLPGSSLGKLFAQAGSNHRFVVAHQETTSYSIKPKQYAPNFAIVSKMRDPQFGKSMDSVLRAAALLAGVQVKLKMVEEDRGAVHIVGERFSEKGEFPNDPENLRFNFSPCFAVVNDQFLFCSTMEFAHEMIDLLQKEFESSKRHVSRSPLQLRLYSAGAEKLLKAFEDQLLAQIILDQAVKPAQGRKQFDALTQWVSKLGQVRVQSEFGEKDYRIDVEWKRK